MLSTTLAGLMMLFVAGCVRPASTTVGTEIDDSVITASVRSALLGDPGIKSFDFQVDTRKGEVQLSGYVDNQAQVERAIALTRGVAGVKSVEDKLSLKGSATTVGNKIDDGVISGKVKAALLGDAAVKSFDIAVVTRKNEVQLSGFVDSQGQIDRAVQVAAGVEGVTGVSNQMSIKK
jgi:hyperosmotically inducible protein